MLAHILFKKAFYLVAPLTELKIVLPERAIILVLKALEKLFATTTKLVRVGEREHLNGIRQKFGCIAGADLLVCVNEDRVWRLIFEVGFKEELKAAVVDDTLSSDDANDCSKRCGELVDAACAFELRKCVLYDTIELGNSLRQMNCLMTR